MNHTDPMLTCPPCKAARRSLRCNCGDGARGHAPDCSYLLGLDGIHDYHVNAIEDDLIV